jgi:hypothetical protein
MGYIALGSSAARLSRRAGQPGIWRKPDETMYDTCRLEFVTTPANTGEPVGPRRCAAGERISVFALISCPNQKREATAALANGILRAGWQADPDGVLAIRIGEYLVYANFSARRQTAFRNDPATDVAPKSGGWSSITQ